MIFFRSFTTLYFLLHLPLIATLSVLTPATAQAQQIASLSNIVVSADEMIRDTENNRIALVGNVQIAFQDQFLACHHATVDLKTKSFVASGNVSMIRQEMKLEGERIEMNYETNKGVIYNGFVLSGAVLFEGELIEKVGDNDFIVKNGYYTACATCPPSWSFSGRRIKAEIGGYAYISSPVLRILDLPLLWLPYLVLPLKSGRETGLLFPTFEFSNAGGTAFSESFFWAIDDHRDLTVGLKNYSNRGVKGLLNHRFYMANGSYGELDAAYIKDQTFPQSARVFGLSERPPDLERWFLKYHHIYDMPSGFVQKTRLNLVSDLQYFVDFPEEIEAIGDPALENRLSLTKNEQNKHYSLDILHYTNLLKSDVLQTNDDAVHRAPELRFSLTETEVSDSGFLVAFDAKYTNFARTGFSYDDVDFNPLLDTPKTVSTGNDGLFEFDADDRDQIRTGQRIDWEPKISYPQRIGKYVDLLPSFSYRETDYQFGVGDRSSVERRYVRGQLSAKTQLHQIYEGNALEGTRYKHEITPEIAYSTIPWLYQPDHPFFGTSQTLPNFRSNQPVSDNDFFSDSGLQFDYFDRLSDRRLASFIINNTLTQRTWQNGRTDYKQIGRFRLLQTYDFIEAEREGRRPRPWSDIEARFELNLDKFETNTVYNFFPYHGVGNIISRVRFKALSGDFLETSYTRQYPITESIDVDRSARSETVALGSAFVSRFFNLYGEGDYSIITEKINSWYYQIQLIPPGSCWWFVYQHRQIIGGETVVKFSFLFSFDGKKVVNVRDRY